MIRKDNQSCIKMTKNPVNHGRSPDTATQQHSNPAHKVSHSLEITLNPNDRASDTTVVRWRRASTSTSSTTTSATK
ncbi:hypothetical protein Pcac1_g28689 [Phytophthora cactorum]|nr:hypothetical protein Pcac1_g28689 [Phytophthora cactorum]